MTSYAILDVEIHDPAGYQEFMTKAASLLEAAGGRYLARGGTHRVYEGDWEPRRLVLLEFPSLQAWESFYYGDAYQRLKALRDRCSSARLVAVAGID